jgi:hypothetical protein
MSDYLEFFVVIGIMIFIMVAFMVVGNSSPRSRFSIRRPSKGRRKLNPKDIEK